MRKILNITLSFFVVLLLASCNKNVPVAGEDDIILDIRLEETQLVSKSAAVSSDGNPTSGVIGVYDEDGKLKSQVNWSNSPVKVTLTRRESYYFCIICNASSVTMPANISQLNSMALSSCTNDGKVVWAGRTSLTKIEKGMNPVAISVERVASKMTILLDKSKIPASASFQVKSVKVKNANAQVYPFGVNSKAANVTDGDQLSTADLSTFNGTAEAYLFIPENIQGTVSSINSAADKIPGNMPSGMADKSTYVEIVASVKPDADFENPSDVTYRFFLGRNATNNFDIERNTAFKVTFRPNGKFFNRNDWKMESPFVTPGDTEPPVVIDPDDGDSEIEIEY